MSLKFHEPSKPLKMSKQKRKLIVLIIAACVVLVSSIIVFAWYMSPRQRMLRAIERSDYNEVISIKNKNSDVLDKKALHLLSEKLTMIEMDYKNGKMDYETALSQIGFIKSIGDSSLGEAADQLQNTISAIDYSKKAYNQGVVALEAGEYGKAIIFLGDVIDSDIDNYSSAQNKRNEAVEKYRDEVIAKANVKAELNDYAAAISILQASFDIIPNDQIINAKISEYHQLDKNQNIDRILSDANASAAKGDLIEAINLIETNITKYDNDERLMNQMNDYTSSFVRNVLTQVKEKENEKNYGEAIRLLTDALNKLPNNVELSDKLSHVQKTKEETELAERKEQLLKEADEALKTDGYEKAISILQSDTSLVSDSDIKAKISEYQTYKPINLFSLDFWDSNNNVTRVEGPYSMKDNLGNEHPASYQIHDIDWTTYVTYRIDGVYNHLKGVFFLDYDSRSTSRSGTINVYNDDNSIIYTVTISKGIDPVNFSVDISGIKNLKIEYISHTGPMADFPGHEFSLCDVTVSK